MSQTNAIILRIKADRADEFERLFKEHQYPNWLKHLEKGGMLAASLTRVEYGVEEEDAKKGRYVITDGAAKLLQKAGAVGGGHIVFAKLTGQRAHDAHDSDPAFKAWDEMAEQFQPEGPSVCGGETILEIG
jgi:hypothetical protein